MALLEILKIDFVSWWGQNSVHLTMLKKLVKVEEGINHLTTSKVHFSFVLCCLLFGSWFNLSLCLQDI